MSDSSYSTITYWQRYLDLYPPELGGATDDVLEQRWSWAGHDVHLDRLPAPSADCVVVLVHGAGGYGRMLLPFARLLGPGQAEVVAPDLPGYGLTGSPGPVHHASWAECVSSLVESERARSGRPVVLFGASMGGLVAYDAAARTGAAGLVVTCLLDPRDAEVRRAVARRPLLGRVAPRLLRLAPQITDHLTVPIRWVGDVSAMSSDPELSAAVARDPVGGGNRVSFRFLRTFLDAVPAVEPEDFDTCPVLLAHPAADTWTPPRLSERFIERIAAPTETVLLEGAGHLPVEQPGVGQLGEALRCFIARVGNG